MALTVGELELLLMVDTSNVEKAEADVKATGKRIEDQKPTLEVDADTKPALEGIERVEAASKKLVSADTIVHLDADIDRAEAQLAKARQRLEELHVRGEAGLDVGADVRRAEAQIQKLERSLQGLQNARSKVDIDADPSAALAGIEKVEDAVKRVVSAEVAARVDADITRAEANLTRIQANLEVLRSSEATPRVLVDTAKAEAQLEAAEKKLNGLRGARAVMEVDADTSAAVAEMGGLEDEARAAGEDAGEAAGDGVTDLLKSAMEALPVAGGVVLAGVAVGKALLDGIDSGLQVEVRQDRLQALTGITEEQAAFFARQAGEAYANNFGESIESNMDTARLALQSGLLDPDATRQDAQKVINSLAGIADVMEEDVQPVANAVTQMMRTGLVKSADEAFDVIATGFREGVNLGDDLIDTFIEYPTHFRDLGLSAEEALGLLNQGLEGGAFNADKVADAMKELTIRVKEGGEDSKLALRDLGLSVVDVEDAFNQGGPAAREAFDSILKGLQSVEDPFERNRLAVALFGTQAEDMAQALNNLDLSTAVESLNGVDGAAQRMFDTLASNDASKIETARRNIEVAADGIKGALAGAFAEPLGEAADWIASNRGPMMQFFLDLANGAIVMGQSVVEGAASGLDAFADFADGVAPLVGSVINVIADLVLAYDQITPGDQGGQAFRAWADTAIESMNGMGDSARDAATWLREDVGGALDTTQEKLNEWGVPAVAEANLHDAMMRSADAIVQVGVAADGTALSLDGLDTSNLTATESGRELEAQLVRAAAALDDELASAQAAGEGQSELTSRYNTTRDALIAQVEQMGIAEGQAADLVDAILKTPATSSTAYSSNSEEEKSKVQSLADRIVTLPDGSVVVVASTAAAQGTIDRFIKDNDGRTIRVDVRYSSGGMPAHGLGNRMHDGGHLMALAGGASLTPMAGGIAARVPPNTWRVIGDRMTDDEFYIPNDGSQRSLALAAEMIRSWKGGWPGLADGALLPGGTGQAPGRDASSAMLTLLAGLPDALADRLRPSMRDWSRLAAAGGL